MSSPGEYLLDNTGDKKYYPCGVTDRKIDQPGGTKHDTGKDPWDLAPWDALREVVRVLAFGAKKYSARNWEKGIVYSRLYAATIRHLTAWWEGEDRDPEVGTSHLANAATDVLFMLAFVVRGRKDLDDRPRGANAS